MPLSEYKQPREGPKIGKQVDVSELPEHKREEIGDFEAALGRTLTDPPAPSVEPPPMTPEAEDKVQLGIDTLDALQRVHEAEGEPEVDTIDVAAEPSVEDKREFIRSMLGNRQYSKTFELFGGTLKIAFGDLTPAQEEELYTELARADLEPGGGWVVTLDRLRLLAYIRGYSFSDEKLAGGVPVTLEGANALVKNMTSATKYSTLMRTARIFRRHLEIMTERSLDSDFWIVDGSSLPPEPLPEEPSTTGESPVWEAGS